MEISKEFIILSSLNVILVLGIIIVAQTDNLLLLTIIEILTFINAVYLVSKVFKMSEGKSNKETK